MVGCNIIVISCITKPHSFHIFYFCLSVGIPRIDKLEIEGRGFHTNLYAVRGNYSGGKEGKSRIQWLRSMVGSPDLISIPGIVKSLSFSFITLGVHIGDKMCHLVLRVPRRLCSLQYIFRNL